MCSNLSCLTISSHTAPSAITATRKPGEVSLDQHFAEPREAKVLAQDKLTQLQDVAQQAPTNIKGCVSRIAEEAHAETS